MLDLNVLNLAPDKYQTQYDMKKLKLTLKLMNPEEEMHIRKQKCFLEPRKFTTLRAEGV